jgi:hypothetical protein
MREGSVSECVPAKAVDHPHAECPRRCLAKKPLQRGASVLTAEAVEIEMPLPRNRRV